MPMYFPDLKSVKRMAEMMTRQSDPTKKYKGIIPEGEADLSRARIELGQYMRTVWADEIAALEIELAVTEKDYDEKIRKGFLEKHADFIKSMLADLRKERKICRSSR